jgi:hypothetical protein
LIAIGAGAGGLVSSKQSARRGAKSAMISAHLAGGDCLNVGVRSWCSLYFVCCVAFLLPFLHVSMCMCTFVVFDGETVYSILKCFFGRDFFF